MDPALPGQPNMPTSMAPSTDAQPQLKSVTITDNGDGTFTVKSSDDQSESPQEQSQEPAESDVPVKSIDEACAKAKEILAGEGREDLKGIFNSQFPQGAKAEQAEYGSRY
jgi:hypothetical protein